MKIGKILSIILVMILIVLWIDLFLSYRNNVKFCREATGIDNCNYNVIKDMCRCNSEYVDTPDIIEQEVITISNNYDLPNMAEIEKYINKSIT